MSMTDVFVFVTGFVSGEIAVLLVLAFLYGAYRNDR